MSNRDTNLQPHHSLPARPPPSTFSAAPSRISHGGTRSTVNPPAFTGFTPRAVVAHAAPQAPAPTPSYSQATVSAPYQAPTYPTSNTYDNYSYPAYPSATPAATYPTVPPAVRGLAGTFDPEEEARIAEWTSAYSRDDSNGKRANGATSVSRPEATTTTEPASEPSKDGKRKTVIREGGGKQWEDETLLEWNPLHPRLFVGNLAGEVTDESLLKAFAKYPSLSKARVVRDKKSTKSRSYGFVSFSDTDDYFRAAKEMQGKYIGSHPVLIKRATSEVKAVTKRDDKHDKNRGRNKNNKNSKDGKATTKDAMSAMTSSAMLIPRGVQKKGKANVPRVLG